MHWIPIADSMLAAVLGRLSVFAHAAAPVAVAALWQGAAIAAVLSFCLRFTPRFHLTAAQRFALWAAAFAAVAALPLLTSCTREAAAGGAIAGGSAPASWLQLDDRWALAIAALWMLVSVTRAACLAAHTLRLRRLWSAARPVKAHANLRSELAAALIAHRPFSGKTVELCTTAALDRPAVIGFFAPRILIPEWLLDRLTPDELEQVVLHEAEHLRRRDDWTNLAQKLALVLFPLNPALFWIERHLCREREMACDEGVVRRTQAPRAYAACLASLAEHGLERRRAIALSLGAFDRRPELVSRVSSLLTQKKALHPVMARALVGVAVCSLLVASLELARCPQMVAFVPAATAQNQRAETIPALAQGEGDRDFAQPAPAGGHSAFRALAATAMVPARQNPGILSAVRGSLPRALAPQRESVATSDREIALVPAAAPPEVLLKAEMQDSDSPSGREAAKGAPATPAANPSLAGEVMEVGYAGRQEVVLFATWTEVATPLRSSGLVADYDTDSAARPQAVDQEKPDAAREPVHPALRITVTRLILWVAPHANATVPSHAPAPKAQPTTGSESGLPLAPAPGSGWLVLQL